jgi:hypothetical protein
MTLSRVTLTGAGLEAELLLAYAAVAPPTAAPPTTALAVELDIDGLLNDELDGLLNDELDLLDEKLDDLPPKLPPFASATDAKIIKVTNIVTIQILNFFICLPF